MSRELMKTISVCLTSSMCTAMFVVACTAAATDGDKGGGDGRADVGGGDDDTADEIDPLPAGSSSVARAVFYMTRNADDEFCEERPNRCCPEGFTFVGTRHNGYHYWDGVCLEDA